MSGRARHLREGVWITNRKTDRRNPKLALDQRPELRLVFDLPDRLAAFTRSGEYGFATVDPDGKVTVRGRDRDFILRKAGEFIQSIAHGLTLEPIGAVLFCPSHPGPTSGAPVRPGYQDGYEIVVTTGRPSVVLARSAIKPVVVP